MKKKYAISIIMILSGIISILGFLLPFYRVDISQKLGSTDVNGTIIISGLSFIIGGNTQNSGYFIDRVYTVIPQLIYMILIAIILVITILSFISLFIKRKDGVLFLILDIFIGLSSIATFVVLVKSLEFADISISNIAGIKDRNAISSEGLAYGAFISSFFILLAGLLSLFLAIISFVDYRMRLRIDNGETESYSSLEDYGDKKLEYHETKAIEHKAPRFLTFKKKEKKEEEKEEVEIETKEEGKEKGTSNKNVSIYERESLKDDNKYGVKTKTGVFDTDYKKEINTEKVLSSEKSKEERIKDLDKLLEEHMISKDDYEKYKEAILKKYE